MDPSSAPLNTVLRRCSWHWRPESYPQLPWGYKQNLQGGIDFFIHPKNRLQLFSAVGYVATLDRAGFTAFDGRYPESYPLRDSQALPKRVPEMRSTEQQVALGEPEMISYAALEAQICSSHVDQLYFRTLPFVDL